MFKRDEEFVLNPGVWLIMTFGLGCLGAEIRTKYDLRVCLLYTVENRNNWIGTAHILCSTSNATPHPPLVPRPLLIKWSHAIRLSDCTSVRKLCRGHFVTFDKDKKTARINYYYRYYFNCYLFYFLFIYLSIYFQNC